MPLRRPSNAEIESIVEDSPVRVTEQELDEYTPAIHSLLDSIERVQELPEPELPPNDVTYPRGSGHRPTDEENPHNVWITKCNVPGADDGPLAGKSVGLKDSISLAGVELTGGSHFFEGYVPDVDATVVTRLLDAGATIRGKLNMDSFAAAGTGDFSDFGAVTNPRSPDHLAGGSSSASGAAPAAGEVDIALGTDQGGSCRTPASWCGIVGLKPTTGLVPYTGVFPADFTIDHVGPLARTVEDVAAALEVIAGPDGLDPRQPSDLEAGEYRSALTGDIDGTTIGVLQEGFDLEESNPQVNETVREAIEDLEAFGADARTLSIEMHRDAVPIWTVIRHYGALQINRQNGVGSHHDGWYNTGLSDVFGKFKQNQGRDFPATLKTKWLAMAYLDQAYHGTLYGKAQNLGRQLRAEYDSVLQDVDVLAMPTKPTLPPEADGELTPVERMQRAPSPKNTCPFNVTGHPAVTVPCGTADGVPVGLMLVGARFDEETVLQVAEAFEDHHQSR